MSASSNNFSALNILLVLRAPVGGLYRHVIDLTEELSKRGHKIGLVMDSSLSDPQTDQRLQGLSLAPALGIHRIPIPRLLGPSDLTAAWRIRSIAKSIEADIIHGHGAKGGFNARLASIGVKNQAAIYTPHGGVLHFAQSSIVGKVLRGLEKMLLGATDAVIFESQFAKNSFEAQIGKVPKLDPVVHNGLLPDEFLPLDADLAEFDFAYVGEIRKLKGIHILLDALVEVTRKDGTPATLIMGGGGPDVALIKTQIDELDLGKRVLMVGVQPALDVFGRGINAVMPSLAESLPYVALEAAAASKPLLASDVGGVKEIFGPTADHLLEAGNVGALSAAMQNYLDDPEAAHQEMEIRYKWVEENFSVHKMADGIEKTYFDALAPN